MFPKHSCRSSARLIPSCDPKARSLDRMKNDYSSAFDTLSATVKCSSAGLYSSKGHLSQSMAMAAYTV
jgi:hypothetical protein